MAAKQRPSFGIRHLTVVPTNFDPEREDGAAAGGESSADDADEPNDP